MISIVVMPLTRGNLSRRLEASKEFFNIDTGGAGPLSLVPFCREFKRKVNRLVSTEPNYWHEINKHSLGLLKEYVVLPEDGIVDQLFADMVMKTDVIDDSRDSCKLLTVLGLQAASHGQFFKSILQKFPNKTTLLESVNEIVIEVDQICIPYNPHGKTVTNPDLSIRAKSKSDSIILSLTGGGSVVFILFYLRKILKSFADQIPPKLQDCYLTPSQPTQPKEDSTSGAVII